MSKIEIQRRDGDTEISQRGSHSFSLAGAIYVFRDNVMEITDKDTINYIVNRMVNWIIKYKKKLWRVQWIGEENHHGEAYTINGLRLKLTEIEEMKK